MIFLYRNRDKGDFEWIIISHQQAPVGAKRIIFIDYNVRKLRLMCVSLCSMTIENWDEKFKTNELRNIFSNYFVNISKSYVTLLKHTDHQICHWCQCSHYTLSQVSSLIGQHRSRDLNNGLPLVQIDHVTCHASAGH